MIESQSEVEAKRKRAGVCAAACENISNEHLELIVQSGGFSSLTNANEDLRYKLSRFQKKLETLKKDKDLLLRELADIFAWSLAENKTLGQKELESIRSVFAAVNSQDQANSPMPVSVPEGWQPIATRPLGQDQSYLVTNRLGQVAPWIRGVIQNNSGTQWDWNYGEAITLWMPFPEPRKQQP